MKRILSVVCATAALLFGLSATTSAAPAPARAQAPCDSVAISNVSDGYGTFIGTYNLKVAPAQECASVASGAQGSKFYFWCYVYNSYNNLWVYGRIAGTTTQGWTSMDNLRWTEGTLNPCPATVTP